MPPSFSNFNLTSSSAIKQRGIFVNFTNKKASKLTGNNCRCWFSSAFLIEKIGARLDDRGGVSKKLFLTKSLVLNLSKYRNGSHEVRRLLPANRSIACAMLTAHELFPEHLPTGELT